MTLDEVKADLRELRYYYSKQRDLDGASHLVGKSVIAEKAERYNAAVRKAPVKLYDLYVSLYVNNNTQLVVALDWDCTVDYIKQLCYKLRVFLKKEMERGGEGNGQADD